MQDEQTLLVSIVDDNQSILVAVNSFLKSCGLATAVFASAEDFLASTSLEKTNCLILDLQLPGMSGLDLQKRLTAGGHRLPIIFVSYHSEPKKREEALQSGAIAFLSKPFSGAALLSAINTALECQIMGQKKHKT